MKSLIKINKSTIQEDLKELVNRFNESLVVRVDPGGLTLKSKIPFKVLSLKELLFHRITMLSQVALDLYLQNKRVPSFILMRSVIETCALCFALRKKTTNFLNDTINIDVFNSFIDKGLSGGRDEKANHQAVNALTCIDHIDREYDGFRKMYDVLCEYAHPNYLGTLDSFGKVDEKNIWLDLGYELKMPPAEFGLAPFFMSLLIFEEQYNLIAGMVEDLNELFEKKVT